MSEEVLSLSDMNSTPLEKLMATTAPSVQNRADQPQPAVPNYNSLLTEMEASQQQQSFGQTFGPMEAAPHSAAPGPPTMMMQPMQQHQMYSPAPMQGMYPSTQTPTPPPYATRAPAAKAEHGASRYFANTIVITAAIAFAALLLAPKLGSSVPSLVNVTSGRLNLAGLAIIAVSIGVGSKLLTEAIVRK